MARIEAAGCILLPWAMNRKNQEIRSATGGFWRRRRWRRPQFEAEEEAGTGASFTVDQVVVCSMFLF
jgi:hypothetical protein